MITNVIVIIVITFDIVIVVVIVVTFANVVTLVIVYMNLSS